MSSSILEEVICIGETGEYINGIGFKESDWDGFGLPIIRIQNLTNEEKPFNFTSRDVEDKYHIKNGDILVSWSATLGAFIWRRGPALLNQHIFKVVPRSEIVRPKFLYYQLKYIIDSMSRSEHAHGSTMKHINRKPFLAHPFWRPSLEHQETVGQMLDKLFSDLDEAERTLQKIQDKLKQARASILKAAVEGRLVETEAEIAKARASQLISASELLAEICPTHVRSGTEKRQMKLKMDYAGLCEPQEVDGISLPNTPEGWAWAFIGSIASTVRNGYSGKPSDHGPVKILRISAVRAMSVNTADTRSLPGHISDYENAVARKGCLLITRYNGNPDLVGVMGHYLSKDLVVHPDKLIRVELVSEKIRPEWIEIAFNTGFTRSLLRKRVRTTAGQAGISGQDIKAMPIPIPPTEEQIRITREVNRRLSVLDQVESTVQASLARCGLLRQAILKRAFEGRLVPAPPEPTTPDHAQLSP